MDNKNSNSMITAVIAVLVLISSGVGILALTQDDDTTDTLTSSEVQQEVPAEEEKVVTEVQLNVFETARTTPQLSTLVNAIVTANLVETLSAAGSFTVFAPTNEAFVAVFEELGLTTEELLARDDLSSILTYHVVAAEVFSTDLSNGQVITTVQGEDLTVTIDDSGVMLTDANDRSAMVVTADTDVSNGVVHLIDKVLLPKI
jgi:uncharacterized surface protein with fasciclin (FAS1) repeats